MAIVALGIFTHSPAGMAEEHTVRMGGIQGLSWVFADRTSTTAEPGKDGRGRLHITVKNGDFVAFPDNSHIVFENGADEKGKVWEHVKVDGPEIRFVPLDEERRKFYPNPDRALMTTAKDPTKRIILIKINNLTAGHPILFASAEYTHSEADKGRMFGAILADVADNPVKNGSIRTPQEAISSSAELIGNRAQSSWESFVLSSVQNAGPTSSTAACRAMVTWPSGRSRPILAYYTKFFWKVIAASRS